MAWDTGEIEAGGSSEVWSGYLLNGNRVFRKNISMGNIAVTGSINISHNITNLDQFVSGPWGSGVSGVATNDSNWFPLPWAHTDDTQAIGLYATTTNVIIFNATDYSEYTATVTVHYTKTA